MELADNETNVGQIIAAFFSFDTGTPLTVWSGMKGPFIHVTPECTRLSVRFRNEGRLGASLRHFVADLIDSDVTFVVSDQRNGAPGMLVPITLSKGQMQEVQFVLQWAPGGLVPFSVHMEYAEYDLLSYTRTVQIVQQPD